MVLDEPSHDSEPKNAVVELCNPQPSLLQSKNVDNSLSLAVLTNTLMLSVVLSDQPRPNSP